MRIDGKKLTGRLALLFFGLLLGLLAGELLLRQMGLQTFTGATHPMDLGPDPLQVMALDEDLGFMPRNVTDSTDAFPTTMMSTTGAAAGDSSLSGTPSLTGLRLSKA